MSRTIFTNGCFDGGLHVGHQNLLVKCRSLAGRHGRVIVGLDADIKVKADKGSTRPIYNEFERQAHLKLLTYPIDSLIVKLIDEVCFFNTNEELYELIKRYKPDIIVKGSDWTNNVVGSDLAEVIHVKRQPISTTKTETRLIRSASNTTFNPEF